MSSSSPQPPSSSSQEAMTEEKKESHLDFMREALAMAEHALKTNETPVGCVFVHNNTIIGRGMNATNRTYNGTRHAEFMAISSILSSRTSSGEKMYSPDVLRECDLYVTVEPCIMCASLLRQIGVRKVYYGASNEKFGGTGGVLSIHRGNGRKTDDGEGKGGDGKRRDDERREERDFEVSGGWLRDEAVVMLQRFYMQENERAPEPRARGKKEAELEGAEDGVVDRRAKMGDG